MKLAVQVNEGPTSIRSGLGLPLHQGGSGRPLFGVFFHHDGVLNGTRLTTLPQDDRNIVNR